MTVVFKDKKQKEIKTKPGDQQASLRMKNALNPNASPFDPKSNKKHNDERCVKELYLTIQNKVSRNLLLFQFKNALNKLPDGNERGHFDENYQNIMSDRQEVFNELTKDGQHQIDKFSLFSRNSSYFEKNEMILIQLYLLVCVIQNETFQANHIKNLREIQADLLELTLINEDADEVKTILNQKIENVLSQKRSQRKKNKKMKRKFVNQITLELTTVEDKASVEEKVPAGITIAYVSESINLENQKENNFSLVCLSPMMTLSFVVFCLFKFRNA